LTDAKDLRKQKQFDAEMIRGSDTIQALHWENQGPCPRTQHKYPDQNSNLNFNFNLGLLIHIHKVSTIQHMNDLTNIPERNMK